MKTRNLYLTLILAFCTLSAAWTQTGVASGTPFGMGEDSIQCRQNISLFTSYAKSQNYKDAYEFWHQAIKECPGSSKNLYIYGTKILDWRICNAKTEEEKQQYIKDLMTLYDLRIQYFGDDEKNGTDWIVANKVSDYLRLHPNNTDYNLIYDWTKPVVDKYGKQTEPQTVYYYVFSSLHKAIGNEAWHETYVKDYMVGNSILEESIDKYSAPEDSLLLNNIVAFKGQLDELFVQSGLADCKLLTTIYGAKLEDNKDNVDFLRAMLDMFRYADCEDAPMYFTASKYLYAIKPTASAAMGLAQEAIKAGRNSEASKYLNDAVGLTNDTRLKGRIYYSLAVMSMNARNYSQARSYANRALEFNPQSGRPLILIAQMYAATASSIYPNDKIMRGCVFYLAVDKLSRARSIDSDPKVQSQASRLIGQYSRYFPSSQELFFHPTLKSGSTVHIGGWIGESTRIR